MNWKERFSKIRVGEVVRFIKVVNARVGISGFYNTAHKIGETITIRKLCTKYGVKCVEDVATYRLDCVEKVPK